MYKFLFKDDKVTVEEYNGLACWVDIVLVTVDCKGYVMYSKDNDVRKFYNKLTEYFKNEVEEHTSRAKRCDVLLGVVEGLKNQPSKCPFCGGEPKMIELHRLRVYRVFCTTCGSETKNFESEREAVDAWNKRV